MPASSTHRVRAFRERCKSEGRLSYDRERKRAYKADQRRNQSATQRPFTGCDGEGAGVDEFGRQQYLLFRMGERELFDDGKRLHTEQLLDFICDHPAKEILVGFSFGYDVTMILRDLPESQARRLFAPREIGEGHSPYVWYKGFNIEYLPRQYFKVCRVTIERDSEGRERRRVVKGSTRTIWETFGFFQKSFVKVIREFEVSDEASRKKVAESKARRAEFGSISQVERDYCGLECEMLAELMEKLREYCHAAGIVPRSWNGAGKLAGALHRLHETLTRTDVGGLVPGPVHDMAGMAYYGGRFEISRVGAIEEKVYEYDLISAYPAAMRDLPCLLHGGWREVSRKEMAHIRRQPDRLFVASCTFKAADHSERTFGGLPIRSKEGHLFWPAQGAGIYWSPEIRSAERLGYCVDIKGGWVYEKHCDCRPFDWVEPLFEYRKSIGKSGPGYPIKLGINSLYGLLAQRKGNGKFTNMIWAGLITAMTRAKLNDAIAIDPGAVCMVATDAVYSVRPLGGLDVGERLGQWEAQTLDGLFIVQPGLYWCPEKRKRKSRGLSGKFFEDLEIDGKPATVAFEEQWERWRQEQNSKLETPFPEVSVPVPGFIGLKLALARNAPDKAGCWVNDNRNISFDYRNKRQGHDWIGGNIMLGIKRGYVGLVSLPHREFLAHGGQEPWEAARLMLEEQPDFVDMSAPYED